MGHVLPSPSVLVSLLSLSPSSPSCSALIVLFPRSFQSPSAPRLPYLVRRVTGWDPCLRSRPRSHWRWQLLCGPFPSQRAPHCPPGAPHCPPGAPPPAPASPLIRAQRREVLLKVVLGPHAANGPAHSGHQPNTKDTRSEGSVRDLGCY